MNAVRMRYGDAAISIVAVNARIRLVIWRAFIVMAAGKNFAFKIAAKPLQRDMVRPTIDRLFKRVSSPYPTIPSPTLLRRTIQQQYRTIMAWQNAR